MSILTLAQLRATRTRAEWRSDVITVLSDLGFSATSWQPGSVQLTIVEAIALVGAVLQSNIAALSYLGFSSDAEGDMLTGLSESHFANDRLPAVAVHGYVRFTGGASGPPHSIGAGSAIVAATVGGVTYQYRNVSSITVPLSGYVDAIVEAEVPGTAAQVGNSTITTLVTSYAGVSVDNPAYGSTGTWVTVAGENQESDASLRERNATKWATLSVLTAIDDRYEYIARTAVSNCRVKLDSSNPAGPGTAYLYLALEDGAAGSTEVTDVQDAITAAYLGPGVTVVAATATAVPVTATVYYAPGATSATVQAAVGQAIADFINGAPIGGYSYGTGEENIIDREGLVAAMSGVADVRRVIVTLPAGDTTIPAYGVATVGTVTLTMTAAAS